MMNPASEPGSMTTASATSSSEVVLDPRARARLPARETGFDDQRIEPFGCGVQRGRKPRRSGADDDDIPQAAPVDPVVEAETLGDLLIGGLFSTASPRQIITGISAGST